MSDVSGEAVGETEIFAPALHGPYSIIGRSLVLHAVPDTGGKPPDPSAPPSSEDGEVLACGVIGVFARVQTF